ncbi:hypothetical protein [Nonomuraea sp. NPDC052265]|uniref:hypothetical protein n=1 Tax=Nonomuraea sp. NPDC052265 TaxID=3364374 RepID=UPI0037C7FBFE
MKRPAREPGASRFPTWPLPASAWVREQVAANPAVTGSPTPPATMDTRTDTMAEAEA